MSGSYRYYESYGTQYRWTTTRQSDGKFHIKFVKGLTKYPFSKTVKERTFAKKRLAIEYCLKASRKNRKHQDEVLKRRNETKEKRKAEKKATQPKGKEKSSIEYTKKVEHTKDLIKQMDKKIKTLDSKRKALVSRKKTHEKKLKYYQKAYKKIRQQIYDEVEV